MAKAKKIVIATKTPAGQIFIHEFSTPEAAKRFVKFAQMLKCEILVGWGE